MANLRAGSLSGFASDTLAGRIDDEFVSLWNASKDIALPDDAAAIKDRRLMFVAIARGLLRYLHDHQGDVGTTSDSADGLTGSEHDHQLAFDWE